MLACQVFSGYRHLLAQRTTQAAFHPAAEQRVEPANDHRLLAFRRTALDGSSEILVAWNVSRGPLSWQLPASRVGDWRSDLISGQTVASELELQPYQAVWILATA